MSEHVARVGWEETLSRQQLTRRQFLITAGGAGAGLVLAGCRQKAPPLVRPSGRAVEAADERRRSSGAALREFDLKAGSADFDLAGRRGSTWGYGGSLPGPEIRVKAGDRVRIRFRNDLPAPTTIHWHGIRVRNDMDGVPKVTQSEVEPGTEFVYKFTVPDPGTFFFHPHMGFQLDRGLYAPFIVEDPSEAGDYDQDITVILDDWTDGVGKSPEQAFSDLRSASGGMPGMQHGGGMERMKPKKEDIEGPLRGDPGDVEYPFYLLNGRPKGDPAVLRAEPRQRLRIRVINAASDTAFRLALGGHRLTVTHTDGFPVDPVTVDALVIGMGERYDLLTTVQDTGAFPLVALAEGKGKHARAILRVGAEELLGVHSGVGGPPQAHGPGAPNGRLGLVEELSHRRDHPDRPPPGSTRASSFSSSGSVPDATISAPWSLATPPAASIRAMPALTSQWWLSSS